VGFGYIFLMWLYDYWIGRRRWFMLVSWFCAVGDLCVVTGI